jgi:hypothetical protein
VLDRYHEIYALRETHDETRNLAPDRRTFGQQAGIEGWREWLEENPEGLEHHGAGALS